MLFQFFCLGSLCCVNDFLLYACVTKGMLDKKVDRLIFGTMKRLKKQGREQVFNCNMSVM